MRLLDLFCGGGGAAKGYAEAGFEVIGVDINRQPNYPFEFLRHDAIQVLDTLSMGRGRKVYGWGMEDIDAIHASPPCQAYTRKQANWGRKRTHFAEHPDLLETTRQLLQATGKPYVIENVPGAPIRGQLMLCGTMFGLCIIKHRYFESNVDLGFPPFTCNHERVYNPWQGAGRSQAQMRVAMGIDWLGIGGGASRKRGETGDLFNAIPPAYTEYIGQHLLHAIQATA